MIDAIPIITEFYPPGDLRELLLEHSRQVRDKAEKIARNSPLDLNPEIYLPGAMLHDVGIIQCDAGGIFCTGTLPYLAHGLAGGKMLRAYGAAHNLDLEVFARIAERHTGTGLSAAEIRARKLPLPEIDLIPETPEEKLICLADKFFSKSGSRKEKSWERIRRGLEKFGPEPLARLEELRAFLDGK